MLKGLILANGKAPKKNIIKYLYEIGYSTLVCADGGSNSAKRMGLIPNVIIGDFDSISPSTLNFYKNKSKLIQIKDQYSTDVEKCLDYLIKKKFEEVILCGVTGDRLDHTFCNLGIVLKFFNKISVNIVAENSFLKAYTGSVKLATVAGETISLYGMNEKTKIKSTGLKFPLNNISLPFGKKESTSNVADGKEVELKISGGIIFIIRDFNLLRKNGLI